MRVDLLAKYREVARVVATPVQSRDGGGVRAEFSRALGAISPDQPQRPERTTQKEQQPNVAPPPGSEVRARLNAGAAPLTPPKLERLPLDGPPPAPVNEGKSSVKAPTVVDVRRVVVPEARASLRPPTPPVEAPKVKDIQEMVSTAGRKHGIDPALSMAVIAAESSFDHRAVSSDGHESKGLMQLLDTTGRELLRNAGLEKQYDPFNPELNVDLGVSYLRRLHDSFGAETKLRNERTTAAAANYASLEKLAVAAFNAGEGRVAAAQERAAKAGLNPGEYSQVESYLPDSTQQYVSRVMRLKGEMEGDFVG